MNYPLYNDELAPIWKINEDGPRLDNEVRKQLLKIAMDFAKDIKENNDLPFKIEDIVLIGSITNYNWTPYSDVDLHISTDYSKLGMDKEKAQTMFDAIKAGWNNKHNIKMKGFDVELYVEDIGTEQVSASKYSVLRNEWIKEPKKQSPNFNKELIKKKYNDYKKEIENLSKQHDETKLKKLLEKIYNYRQAGLDKGGELSEENIVFRMLRAKGHLDKLKDNITKIYDKKVSVKEVEKLDDGISSSDGKSINWMADDDEGEYALVPTDDEDKRRFFTVYGMKVFAAYRVMPKAVQAMKDDGDDDFMEQALVNLRHAVKHPESKGSSKSIVNELVDISVKRFFNNSNFDASKITVIIPLGSKSKLNNLIAKKIQKRLPDAIIMEDFVQKDKWKNVRLSKTFFKQMKNARLNGKDTIYYDNVIKDLESKKRNHGEEEFEIKKVGATNRLYYSMFYKTSDNYSDDMILRLNGANVLVIDDTLEAGSTLIEAHRAIQQFLPADILTYIFLFGRYATVPKAVKMGVQEIAINKSGYEKDIEDAAYDIYTLAKAFKQYPDIEPYIKKISLKYKKYSDDVHIDIARVFSKIRK